MISSITTLILLLCSSLVFTQPSPEATATAPTLEEVLTFDFLTFNEPAQALFPLSILLAQTSVAIRFALTFTVVGHDLAAACHPVALSFFGTKDEIDPKFCASNLSRLRINAQFLYRVLATEFPVEAASWGAYLVRNGLNPFDQTTDESVEEGWANVKAKRLARYLANDGWNSLGDRTRDNFRQPFEDYTGYEPQNQPHLPPDQLRKPLRWQPLSKNDFHGDFSYQIHVTPQLSFAKTLAMTQEEFKQKKAPDPYATPNRKGKVGKRDMKTMTKLINKLFKRSEELTDEKIVNAFFWENKFVSLGTVIAYYQQVLDFDGEIVLRLGMGEMIAQYDALLTVWKEKRRHDLVRPETIIRRLFKGRTVNAFKNVFEGVGEVLAEEWQPLIAAQPHSEYPSGSATICAASFEHLQIGLDKLVLKGNATLPSFDTVVLPNFLPRNPVQETVILKYATLKDAATACGESRLDAGVHFEPAVKEGFRLGRGIGRKAFQHVSDLFAGRVPANCERCIKS